MDQGGMHEHLFFKHYIFPPRHEPSVPQRYQRYLDSRVFLDIITGRVGAFFEGRHAAVRKPLVCWTSFHQEPIGMALPITAIPPNIAGVSVEARLRMTIEATTPKVAAEVGQQLKQLLQPQTLAIAAGILVIWAGLHFTGVGEVADAAILVVGWIALGAAAWQGARELVAFAIGVKQARTPQDIDRAADHLAKAIGLIGIQAVLSLLLHTAPKPYREPGNLSPKFWKGWWNLGTPPLSPNGALGLSAYGTHNPTAAARWCTRGDQLLGRYRDFVLVI